MSTNQNPTVILMTSSAATCQVERHQTYLSAADYVVFSLVLIVSVMIGLFYWLKDRKSQTAENFLMANRQMSIIPVSLSMLASFMSTLTILGAPVEIYTYGTQYWMLIVAYAISIPIASYIFIPVFYRLRITSVFEYLEQRFSVGLRNAGALLFIAQTVLYIGMVLYMPTLALSAVTGMSVWAAVLTIGIVCTLYTTLGGMKAVMWTDAFQIFMMLAGLAAILIKGSLDHGGFGNIFHYLSEGNRIEFFNMDPDPLKRHTFWSLTIGGTFMWLTLYGVNQSQVQRALCTPSLKQGQAAMWLNIPGLAVVLTVCCLCGAVCYAEYRNCDPLTSGLITASDQLLPRYVMDRLSQYPGLPGLFVACLFSGGLSTISSGLNSLAAVTLQDFVRRYWFPCLTEHQSAWVSKLLAAIFGGLMILMAYMASHMGALLQAALGIFGIIGGPTLGVYSLGLFYPWANSKGAAVGLACSLAWTLWIGVGAQIYKPTVWRPPVSVAGCPVANCTTTVTMATDYVTTTAASVLLTSNNSFGDKPWGYLSIYEMSYLWYSLTSIVIAHAVGLLVSFLTGANRSRDVDPRLLCPIADTLCCCLPKSWRRAAYCDARFDEVEKNIETSVSSDDVQVKVKLTSGLA